MPQVKRFLMIYLFYLQLVFFRSSRCVSHDVICDGVIDCPDGEDEEQCYKIELLNKK